VMRRIVSAVLVLLLGAALTTAACCDGAGGGGGAAGGGGGGGETPAVTPAAPAALPDLNISDINVYPSQPQAGSSFYIDVYVSNEGDAPSGDFLLEVIVIEVPSQLPAYYQGLECKDVLQPGDDVPVFTTDVAVVSKPGSYQVNATITPHFDEADPWNNSKGVPFTATQ